MGISDSPLRDRVIFVQGAPRSGTTFLVTLLATHRQIAGVEAESHLFDFGVDRLFDNYEGRHQHVRGLDSYLESRRQLVDLVRDLCDGVLTSMRSHVTRGSEPELVVEKTPIRPTLGKLDLQRKRECFPDAWYLHIVRDGEAVTRSLMRAPWLGDRSSEACSQLWSEAVAAARESLGDHPRYREVSYERLRDDPVLVMSEVFRWLGVEVDEGVEDNVRVLAKERFSDLGAVTSQGGGRARLQELRDLRGAVARARAGLRALRNRPGSKGGPPAGRTIGFDFVRALRDQDEGALTSIVSESFSLVYRSRDGDLLVSGREARTALLEIAGSIFDRRHIGEWWASTGVGAGEWWTSAPGQPFLTVLLSAIGGDASRVDLSLGISLRDGSIARVVAISAGPLAGRPLNEIGVGQLAAPAHRPA